MNNNTESLLSSISAIVDDLRQELRDAMDVDDNERAMAINARIREMEAHQAALTELVTPPQHKGGTGTNESDESVALNAEPVPAKRTAPNFRRETNLDAARSSIVDSPPGRNDIAFTHSVLCQLGLPRRSIKEREFFRQTGEVWLSVKAGYIDEGTGPVEQPVPYGALPRLALAWISTAAVKTRSPEIYIGKTAAEFLRLLGMDAQGARYAALSTQMKALAACSLQMGFRGQTFNEQVVRQFDAWATPRQSEVAPVRNYWPGRIILTDDYFREISEHSVPLDSRALHALKGSALELDIYAWLAQRLHRITGNAITISWTALREQFAIEYKGKDPGRDFKRAFSKALANVLKVYPEARVKTVYGGIELGSSAPPVPYNNGWLLKK